jgi:beta-phosphoglucomutase-like phosphatase (HAD superfamily)
MLRVIMFDLGLTLIDEHDRPFPHVMGALTAIQQMRGERKKPLALCLVSDFKMPAPPPTPAKVDDLFAEYLTTLEETGLRRFFEPVGAHVTLSTHAGVNKPAREIFALALRRLRSRARLPDCLFISENAAHVAAARDTLEMQTLLFRAPGATAFDFDDWAQAPLLIARLLPAAHNLETAVAAHLRAAHDFEPEALTPGPTPGTFIARGKSWHPLRNSRLGPLDGVLVPIPAEAEVTLAPTGHAAAVRIPAPTPEQLSEAGTFVDSLARHGQIEDPSSSPAAGGRPTHALERDAQGRRRLVRRGFSAI